MREFEIVVEAKVQETYTVVAESIEKAREMWDNGDVITPDQTEVWDINTVVIEDITEEDEA